MFANTPEEKEKFDTAVKKYFASDAVPQAIKRMRKLKKKKSEAASEAEEKMQQRK